jgi:ubiquinone/menaquinone biosynthesis C-methylase UbiE
MSDDKIKKAVREGYGKIARGKKSSCCGPQAPSCCSAPDPQTIGRKIGYSEEELSRVPEGANLGLGCGNPIALASLRAGETVLDLGSGAGFDCFLAAAKVGPSGKVIGVDMTPEMVARGKENIVQGGYKNVEFRLGEIDNLPLADHSVDVVISNCVVNLVPDKAKVFAEVYRVLVPGGRFMISDMVTKTRLPDFIRESIEAHISCLGAALDEYLEAVRSAGFEEIRILKETPFPYELMAQTAEEIIKRLKVSEKEVREFAKSVVSITISGFKPREAA